MVWTIGSVCWWLYLAILAPSVLFSAGFYEFMLGGFSLFILGIIPFVFYSEE